MLLTDIIDRIKYNNKADRIGPDHPFTHWQLYFKKRMLRLCKKKFKHFADTADFRSGAYAVCCSKISIGERVVIRPGSMLFAEADNLETSITIEDNVMLGSGIQIYVHNHRFDRVDIPLIDQGYYEAKPVILKNGCWLGANVIVLPGVVIGENSVIGAASVVTKSIPPGVVAAGNPARVIKNIGKNEI
ncbi:acyltransferase [Flavobacterium cerinum]|uniref:Acyltransferase n=1 Tax=Flavobacterium cerinum TaxID=2502784 RepID=A0A3S3QA89_9FLAO|nr:acyltransferase [Flavobacterium cerinum]RWX02387.1 acyltransferase [Flavobacterium cerinum]